MNKDTNQGRLLANRYELSELVGEGAMGRVYRAKDTVLGGVIVAVKFLAQALMNDSMRDRFEREATISALLGEKSIHVVRVKDYGVDEHNSPFYVMEFLAGESINELISYQPIPLKRFLILARHVCLGLEAAHQGISFNGELCRIIHRDIKPSNIIVLQDPTLGEVAKILDFGIAKLIQASANQTQSFMGTLAYCSPEQMEGKELDSRSDIYSLGVMMYEMLTMDMPLLPQNSSFGGWYQAHHNFKPEPFSARLNLPEELQNLVFRCLEKERDLRPQSAREIMETLEKIERQSQFGKTNPGLNINTPEHLSKNTAKNTLDITLNTTFSRHATLNAVNNRTVNAETSVTEICLQTPWPQDKPLSKIVFAQIIDTPLGEVPVLCVMLEQEDIYQRISCTRYNQFLYLANPHPTLLWITVLYNSEHGVKWLPCYLDLKSHKGQGIARTMANQGKYRILFYSLDEPRQCQHIITSIINLRNCQMLQEWANLSQVTKSLGDAKIAKKVLQQELEKLKDKILTKVKASKLTDVNAGG
ncbi:serine/threonine protein kinase [Pleurocapsa sp. CCALA 161]|uniref:serine/threonine protein kinase n=1 Tax=Pleurocapsa sp. CCALA 161 TaxID=2107688 RepID=UPI000D052A85|nr:serine/threonine-protein kinase [Pleurocapsa sp. CCALA 161]PSB11854.1 serine/threonine protein kinase [Pleurocapsa sp. CCALA 161]